MIIKKNLKILKGFAVWIIKDDNGEVIKYYGKKIKTK